MARRIGAQSVPYALHKQRKWRKSDMDQRFSHKVFFKAGHKIMEGLEMYMKADDIEISVPCV